MERPLFCYPNYIDDATAAGGSFESTLPLSYTQDRRPRKAARSVDTALASTFATYDFGELRRIRAMSIHAHNLSLLARRRYRLYPTPSVVRADTATYHDEDGLIVAVADNVLRNWHYLTDQADVSRRVTLIERAYTNLVSSAAITGWGTVGTPVITGGQDDPRGGTAAYLMEDDGSSGEAKRIAVTFTGDGTKSVAVKLKAGTSTESQVAIYDGTATTFRHIVLVTWTDGVPTPTTASGSGTVFKAQPLTDDWWVISFNVDSVTAANTNYLYIYPCGSTAADTGTVLAFEPAAFDAAVPPASALDAAEATTVDSLTIDMFDSTPQATTWLLEAVVLDLPNTGTGRVMVSIGDNADNRIFIGFNSAADALFVQYRNASTTLTYSWDYAPDLYDHIVVRVRQESDGSITGGLKINGGSEAAFDNMTSDQALISAWGNPRVRFGNTASGGGNPCNVGIIQFRGQSGEELTVAEMQAVGCPDIFDWTVYDSGWGAAYPAIYPAGSTVTGQSVGGLGVTPEQWADGKLPPVIVVLDYQQFAGHFSWEVDDTANPDTWIDVGRPFAGPGWQPQTSGIQAGAKFTIFDPTTAELLVGSSAVIRERVPYKVWGFDLDMMESNEARTELVEFRRRIGKRGQFLFVFDPSDPLALADFSFLARCDTNDPAVIDMVFRFSSPFALVEDL